MNTPHVLKLGISPCPNDTFAFYHLLKTQKELPFQLETVIADVEELNQRVFDEELDISKVSFHLFAHVSQSYLLLDAGSALGRGCGPLILSRPGTSLKEISDGTVALPGRYTTAAMLFRMFMAENGLQPKATTQMLFSEIPGAVAAGKLKAGVVIHETRFTYRQMGLECLQDLGQWWEQTTGMPIPLGGIIAKKSIDRSLLKQFNQALQESIDYAFRHMDEALAFSMQYAQEMDSRVMKQHIGLYVNDFTRTLGIQGKKAIEYMFEYGSGHGLFSHSAPDFL